jgi:DNA-binding response OmpR family regulator
MTEERQIALSSAGMQNSGSRGKRILLVDSDPLLRGTLAEQLAQEGFDDIAPAGNFAQAREALAQPCAFAIIDQNLPDGSGEEFARELRQNGFSAPILLLADEAASDNEGDRIAKPFRFSALLDWLNAHGGGAANRDPIAIGPYLFQPGAKLLTDPAQRKIRLTEKETNILAFLHAAARTVPREILLHEVWGYNPSVTTHTLETHIYRLRRKIEENPGNARILLTEDGGYRLVEASNV